ISNVTNSAPPACGFVGHRQFRMRIRRSALGSNLNSTFVSRGRCGELDPAAFVVAQNAQPVKDRSRVPEYPPGRTKVDSAFELEIQTDGGFTHVAIAELTRHHQQFEIKRKLLDGEEWEGLEEHLLAEELEPSLCVTHIKVEQQPNQDLVGPALEPAKSRIRHL